MRTSVATALLAFRAAVVVLCSASLFFLVTASDKDYLTPFKLLQFALSVQLCWSIARLYQDARVILGHAALPDRYGSYAIIIGEFACSCVTLGGGACALAAQVYFDKDIRQCATHSQLGHQACSRYKTAAVLDLSAAGFTTAVAFIILFLMTPPLG